MKTLIETRPKVTVAILFCAVASRLVWLSATGTSQTFTILKSFGNLTNITGINPSCQLVQGPDGTVFGTTSGGDGISPGTVFNIQPDGGGSAVLKWFTASIEGALPYRPNRQGWAAVRSDSSSAIAAAEGATASEMVNREQHRRAIVLRTALARK